MATAPKAMERSERPLRVERSRSGVSAEPAAIGPEAVIPHQPIWLMSFITRLLPKAAAP
jgi:hypothetical protein